jgi:ubiquinone/menaquinone biosynthesis C-methylase UbiE
MDKATQVNLLHWDSFYGQKDQFRNILQYSAVVRRQLVDYAVNKVFPRRDNLRVLDVGFGNGANLFLFPTTCALYGVELSTSAVDFVTAEAKRKEYHAVDLRISQDATQLTYDDNMFDVVIGCHVIEHLQDDLKMLTEIRRVLLPTGAGILQIPIDLFDTQAHSDSTLLNPAFEAGESYHVRRYNVSSFCARLEAAGFDIVDEIAGG